MIKFSKTLIIVCLFFSSSIAETELTKISFKHNTSFNRNDLLDIIHSEEGDDFEPRLVKLDRILLNNFFRKNGYLVVNVEDSLFFSENRQTVRVKYIIDSGPRYYYNGVRFDGVQEIDTTKLNKQFEDLEIGVPFDEGIINERKILVENVYYNSGKPFASIKTDYLFKSDSLIVTVFSIIENQTIYITKINYLGLNLVQKFLIRRELEIAKGDIYNREALEKSQQNIYGTGLFRFVRLEIEPIPERPQNVILKIIVQEKDAKWIGVNFGVGHEQYYGSTAEFTLQGGHRNIFGTARSASLHLTPSFLYQFENNSIINAENKISFKFIEPWILNTRTPGIFQVSYHQYRLPNSGDFNLVKTSFELHRKFDNDIELSGTLSAKFLERIDDEKISAREITEFDQGTSDIYSISIYTKRDTRPNLFNPTSGSLVDFSLSFSQSVGKTDKNITEINRFFTATSSWSRYQPWQPRIGRKKFDITLASRIKTGGIFELDETKYIPITELFFAGGSNTVRGYQEQLLGPAASFDDNGKIDVAAGGKFLILANIEARIPIFWLFVGEVFVDGGNVWRELTDFRFQELRFSTGVGLAVITPLGPIRVDYGYKLQPRSIDPSKDAFHLGIYFAF